MDSIELRIKAGNAPVAPLVLHGAMSGGNHLPSGDPNARLPCLFHKKKMPPEMDLCLNCRYPLSALKYEEYSMKLINQPIIYS